MSQRQPPEPIHVVHVAEAATGGVRTHVLQLLRGLRPAGFTMTLIASAERDARFRSDLAQLQAEGVRVIELPMKRRLAPLGDLVSFFRLRAALRKLRPDIVHTHASKAGALGRLAAHSCRVKTVVHTPHTFYFQGCGPAGRRFFRAIERLLLRFTDCLVVLAEGQRRLAATALGADTDKARLIHNGVDTNYFAPRRRRDQARHSLGLPLDAPVVGTITRFRRQKGTDVFLRAAAALAAEMPAAHFVLVGSGPHRDALHRLAGRLGLAPRLTWREHCGDPREIYEALDVFVLSSRYEGLPYALLEAMSMSLPVAGPRISGCEEVVTVDTGILVPPEDPQSLARALANLLNDPAHAQQLGVAGRARVTEHFSLDSCLRHTAALYRSLVQYPEP